jgi:hypothetical protein
MKRMGILVVFGLLAGCGDKGPSSSDIEGAVMSRISQQYDEAAKLYGTPMAEFHALLPSNIKVVSIDNIRQDDDATYLADVTLERLKNHQKDTRAVSLRQIEGAWRVVSQ